VTVEPAVGVRGGVRKVTVKVALNAGHRFIKWVALDGRGPPSLG
jgi:hypothetical protein